MPRPLEERARVLIGGVDVGYAHRVSITRRFEEIPSNFGFGLERRPTEMAGSLRIERVDQNWAGRAMDVYARSAGLEAQFTITADQLHGAAGGGDLLMQPVEFAVERRMEPHEEHLLEGAVMPAADWRPDWGDIDEDPYEGMAPLARLDCEVEEVAALART